MPNKLRQPAIGLRCPTPVLEAVDRYAARLGISRSEVVRRFLLDGLERVGELAAGGGS